MILLLTSDAILAMMESFFARAWNLLFIRSSGSCTLNRRMKTKLVHAYSANSLAPPNTRSLPPLSRSALVGDDAIPSNFRRRVRTFSTASTISDINLLRPTKVERIHVGTGIKGYWEDLKFRTFKRKTLYKKVPFLSWIQEYNANKFLADLIAGFIISLSVLPQSLAYASISGLPPQVGLYSAFVGPFVYVFFGTSNFVTIGPTAGLAMITLAFIEYKPPELYVFLAFVTGLMIFLMGICHLGFILNFISKPVISGFTSAMAISICAIKLPSLLGMDYHEYSFIDMLRTTIDKIGGFNWQDLTLGIGCIIVIVLLKHCQQIVRKLCHPNRVPEHWDDILWFTATARNAIVVLTCTVVFGFIGDPLGHTPIGDIKPGIIYKTPPFWFPYPENFTDTGGLGYPEGFNAGKFLREYWSALVLFPLIAVTEHLTIAKDLDGGNDRLDTSQEMICIGLSNLIGSFFGSMPVTGSFVRPNTSNKYIKDQTPLGGCVTGILVILTLAFLTPQFVHIPRATVGAVIVAQVAEEIEFKIVLEMWRCKKWDILPWLVTFACGLFVTLEHGLLFGLAISGMYILYYAALPQINVNMGQTGGGKPFVMVELDRSLIFPAVDYTEYALMKSGTIWAHDKYPVVIDCQHIQFLDYTAAYGFQSLFQKFNDKSQKLILWKMKPSALRIVKCVMDSKGINFEHCETETKLESWLELSGYIKNQDLTSRNTNSMKNITEEDGGIEEDD